MPDLRLKLVNQKNPRKMKKIYLSLLLIVIGFSVSVGAPTLFTPELVAPLNNQTGVAPNVLLDWNPVVGTVGLHYVVQLSLDEEFTDPVEFTTDLSSAQMAELKFATTYFWRVKAVDATGMSEWTEARSFTVIVRPTLRRPANNANNVDANVLLQWDPISGLSHFDYQIDTAATFDSPFAYITSVKGTLKEANTSNLLFGTGHYVRLRARHAEDVSDWTAATYFTVTSTFNLSKPNDNATDLTPDTEFQWTAVKGINRYYIYLSTEPEMLHYDMYNVAGNLTRIKPDTLMFGTQYYWKMSAIHAKDTLFSATRTFKTVNSVSLVNPANNATNVVLQPALTWKKLSGVLKYQLQLANNSEFKNARTYTLEATGSTGDEQFKVPLHVLDSANVYYWRVNAISSRDTADWSETRNFRCVALGIDDPSTALSNLSVYPSPASDFVAIRMKNNVDGVARIQVYDLLGKTRISHEERVDAGIISRFDLSTLPDGIYMLHIEVNGMMATQKIIIRK